MKNFRVVSVLMGIELLCCRIDYQLLFGNPRSSKKRPDSEGWRKSSLSLLTLADIYVLRSMNLSKWWLCHQAVVEIL